MGGYFGDRTLELISQKNPLAGLAPGGESLAAPRGVSDASRRCKQRPLQAFRRRMVFQQNLELTPREF